MTITISTAVRNARCAATTAQLDAGSAAAKIQLRDGTRPAGPGTAATGTLIATLTLNDPAFGSPTGGVATADVDPAVTATAASSGTPTWFRALDSDDVAVFDGDVPGDMTVTPSTVSAGAVVSLTSMTITEPAS